MSDYSAGFVKRFLRFNSVGVIGFGVHMGVLGSLFHLAGLGYLAATVIAVEAAVLHNFLWHERWTWKERPSRSTGERLGRLVRFQASNGAVSLIGNAIFMEILAGRIHLPVMAAALISVLLCSAINFLFSDQWVFQVSREKA